MEKKKQEENPFNTTQEDSAATEQEPKKKPAKPKAPTEVWYDLWYDCLNQKCGVDRFKVMSDKPAPKMCPACDGTKIKLVK